MGPGGSSSGKRRWPGEKGSGRGDASVICLLYKIHMRMFGWLILVFVRQRRRVPGEKKNVATGWVLTSRSRYIACSAWGSVDVRP